MVYSLAGTSLGPYATYSGGAGALYETDTEIQVIIETDGVEGAALTATTQYTISGATPLVSGGSVVLNASVRPGANWTSDGKSRRLILRRQTVVDQPRPFGDAARFQPGASEQAFDKLTRAAQDLLSRAVRAAMVPQGESPLSFPPLAARKGMLSTYNASTGALEAVRSLAAFDGDVSTTASKAAAAAGSAVASALSAGGAATDRAAAQTAREGAEQSEARAQTQADRAEALAAQYVVYTIPVPVDADESVVAQAVANWTDASETASGAQFAPAGAKALYVPGGQTQYEGGILETIGSGATILGDGNASQIMNTAVRLADYHAVLKDVHIRNGSLTIGTKTGQNRMVTISNVDLYNSTFDMEEGAAVNKIVGLELFKPPNGTPSFRMRSGDTVMTNFYVGNAQDYITTCLEIRPAGQFKTVNGSFAGRSEWLACVEKQVVESYFDMTTFVGGGNLDYGISSVNNSGGVARFTIAGTRSITGYSLAGNRVINGMTDELPYFDVFVGASTVGSHLTAVMVGGVDVLHGNITFATAAQARTDITAAINAYSATSGWQCVDLGNRLRIRQTARDDSKLWAAITSTTTGGFSLTGPVFIEATLDATHSFSAGQMIQIFGTQTGTPAGLEDAANAYDYVHEFHPTQNPASIGFYFPYGLRAYGALGSVCRPARLAPGVSGMSITAATVSSYVNSTIYITACGPNWFEASDAGGTPIAYNGAATGTFRRHDWDMVFKARDAAIYLNDQSFTNCNSNYVLISSGFNIRLDIRGKNQIWIDKRIPVLHADRVRFCGTRRGRSATPYLDIPICGSQYGWVIADGDADDVGAPVPKDTYLAARVPLNGAQLVNNIVTSMVSHELRPEGVARWGVNGSFSSFDGSVHTAPAFAGRMTLPDGAYNAPSLNFSGGGLYWDGSRIGFAFGGIKTGHLTSNALTLAPANNTSVLATVAAAGAGAALSVQGEASTGINAEVYASSTTDPTVAARKARGTLTAPAAVQLSDWLGRFNFSGYTGAAFTIGAQERVGVTEPTVSASAMGVTKYTYLTPLGSATLTEFKRESIDNGLQMYGANTVIDPNRSYRKVVKTVGTLPSANPAGQTYHVSDANAATLGATVAGGGANFVPVTSDGTNWKIG